MIKLTVNGKFLKGLSEDCQFSCPWKRRVWVDGEWYCQAYNCLEDCPSYKRMAANTYIDETIENGKMHRTCSACAANLTELTSRMIPDFCPYCGAKLTGIRKAWETEG